MMMMMVMMMLLLTGGKGRRTFYIFFPCPFQIDFRPKTPSDHGERVTPGKRICYRIVFVQIVLGEPRIHTFVRVDGVFDSALQPARANARSDALLHRPFSALYAQHLGSSGHADCRFAFACALRKMHQHSEGRTEALLRIGNGARVVSD